MNDNQRQISADNELLVRELKVKAAQLEQANRELAARERHLRAIFDTEPGCLKLLAADGSLLEMNPAGLRMLEADSFQQVEKHCVYPLVVEPHRPAFRELIAKAFRGESGALEFEIVGLKGGRRWLEMAATPLRDDAGGIIALLGISRDITESKRAEQELQTQLVELRRWQQATLGREDRVLELKHEVNKLCQRLGEPPPYATEAGAP